LVPRPRTHLTRYHGVFAPNARHRRLIVKAKTAKRGAEDPDEADPVVGETILEFAKIDRGSYSYRYPVDRKGNPVPVKYGDLHLPTLADVIKAVDGYFTGCDGYLNGLLNN